MDKASKNETISEIWQRSEITGVPQIARSKGWNQVFKLAVFFLMVVGMAYQAAEYIMLFYSFPVVLEVEMTYPRFILLPTMTVCMGSSLDRRKYCQDFPDHCEGEKMLVKPEFKNLEYSATREMFQKYGFKWDEVVFLTYKGDADEWVVNKEVVKQHVLDMENRRHMCYAINQKAFEPKSAYHNVTAYLDDLRTDIGRAVGLLLYRSDKKIFRNEAPLNPQIATHSPYFLQNPYVDGKAFIPGRLTVILFKLEIINLLPAPYETDCYDYLGHVSETNRDAPTSREQCIQKCIFERSYAKCGCMLFGTLHITDVNFCENKKEFVCLEELEVDTCYTSCKPDCKKLVYKYKVVTRNFASTLPLMLTLTHVSEKGGDFKNFTPLDNSLIMGLVQDGVDVLTYSYQPKYEVVELFMYLGGYLGLWLGLSIIEILDLLDILTRIAAHISSRRSAQKASSISKGDFPQQF